MNWSKPNIDFNKMTFLSNPTPLGQLKSAYKLGFYHGMKGDNSFCIPAKP